MPAGWDTERRFAGISLDWVLALLVGFMFGIDAGQPILENFVGRQIPTAMVARNIERGSGFFHPQLDTGPFPNLFLVEPPIYAQAVVIVARMTGLPLEQCGRFTSAIGMVLLCWGTSGLLRRRQDAQLAEFVYLLIGVVPIFYRFGRAFQPDAFALGLVLAGSRVWDRHEAEGGRSRSQLMAAWLLTSLGVATKVTTAFALVPLILVILRPRSIAKVAVVLSTLVAPALWYIYAASKLRDGGGSRASVDNVAIWLSAVSLVAWTKVETYRTVASIVGWRAFSPIGIPLALWGLFHAWPEGRYWRVWFFSATAALVLLGGKLHHEYYFLAIAPAVWVGILRAMLRPEILASKGAKNHLELFAAIRLLSPRRRAALLCFSLVPAIVLAAFGIRTQNRSRMTPPEWAAWPRAVEAIRDHVQAGEWLAAPEALLYLADRKGCRLEYEPKARVRAAGEWGATIDRSDPLALVDFYKSKGAKYVADLWPVADEPDRRALHEAIRRRYNVIMDRDGVIVAELVDRRK